MAGVLFLRVVGSRWYPIKTWLFYGAPGINSLTDINTECSVGKVVQGFLVMDFFSFLVASNLLLRRDRIDVYLKALESIYLLEIRNWNVGDCSMQLSKFIINLFLQLKWDLIEDTAGSSFFNLLKIR